MREPGPGGARARARSLDAVRRLVHVAPAPPGHHRVALRAGLSVALPLLALVLTGCTAWAVYAAFGAFASLYARRHTELPRAAMQAGAGLVLTSVVTLGALSSALDLGPWGLVLASALVAGVGQVSSEILDWHPPGPLFVVFAFGTVSAVPATLADVPVAAAVAATSAAVAVAIGGAGALARRTPWTTPPPLRVPSSVDPLRYVLVVLVAGGVATAAGIGHPWWAMVAAAAPLSAIGRDHQAVRAGHRVLGTIAGLGVAAPLLLLGLDPVPLVLVVGALQVATELVVARNYGIAMVLITPMALLMVQLGAPRPPADLLLDRGFETLVGALVALALIALEHALRPEVPR